VSVVLIHTSLLECLETSRLVQCLLTQPSRLGTCSSSAQLGAGNGAPLGADAVVGGPVAAVSETVLGARPFRRECRGVLAFHYIVVDRASCVGTLGVSQPLRLSCVHCSSVACCQSVAWSSQYQWSDGATADQPSHYRVGGPRHKPPGTGQLLRQHGVTLVAAAIAHRYSSSRPGYWSSYARATWVE
jgi:hypothetical protein